MKWVLLFILWGQNSGSETVIQRLEFGSQAACEQAKAFIKDSIEETDEAFAEHQKEDRDWIRREVDAKCIQND